MADNWSVQGTYFDACNCEIACPCYFGGAPTDGHCNGIISWHIERGNYGTVTLDGLNVALWADIPGHLLEVKWKVALYLDDRASEAQKESLTNIFSGAAGGHPAMLASFIGEVIGVDSASIDYREDGKTRTLRVSQVANVEFQPIEGQNGDEVTISNQPIAVAPGAKLTVGKSKSVSYKDHGIEWEVSDKNVFSSPFAYEGP